MGKVFRYFWNKRRIHKTVHSSHYLSTGEALVLLYRVAQKKRSQTKGLSFQQDVLKIESFVFFVIVLVPIFSFWSNFIKIMKIRADWEQFWEAHFLAVYRELYLTNSEIKGRWRETYKIWSYLPYSLLYLQWYIRLSYSICNFIQYVAFSKQTAAYFML